MKERYKPKTVNAFLKHIEEDVPIDEVAREFGIKEGSVRKIKSRVLQDMRKEFGVAAE